MVIKTVTMLMLLTLSVTVLARHLDTVHLQDHYLVQPKLDFEPQYGSSDGSRLEDQNRHQVDVNREIASYGDEKSGYEDHRGLNTEFSRQNFNRNGNVHRSVGSRDFGSFGQEYHDSSINNHREIDSSVSQNRRTDGTENLGDNYGSDVFNSQIPGRSYKHRSTENRLKLNTNFEGSNQELRSSDIGSHVHGRTHHNHRNTENSFYQNSDRTNHENQGFGKTDSRDRSTEIHNQREVNNQRDSNSDRFEIVSSDRAQNFGNQYENRRNIDATNKDVNRDRGSSNQNVRTNFRKTPDRRQENNQNTRKTQEITNTERSSGGRKQPEVKSTPGNEVSNKKNKNNNNKNTSNKSEEDKLIWSGEKTTIVPEMVDLNNRNAFNGDKCPLGKIKIKDTCVEVD